MTNELQFNGHPLVDFDKLFIGDSQEIFRLQKAFEANGWCFIQLPDQKGQLADKFQNIQKVLTEFFARDQARKSKYESSNSLGYSRVGHKEGIKVLIDQDGLQNYHSRLTKDVEEVLKYLATLFYNLASILKSTIHKMPTFFQSQSKEIVPLSPLGMLDIVHYFNERTGPPTQPKVGLNTNEVNCVPHFDPGLFSLSILSTCDGLQLNDRMTDTWIDGPNNSEPDQRYIGVIWLGEAASILTQNRFKSGIHRVVYPRIQHQPRLTIWQEVCTQDQIDTIFQQDDSNNVIPDNFSVQMINQTDSLPLRVRPGGESVKKLMKRAEDIRGLSPSKTVRRHIVRVEDTKRMPSFPEPKVKSAQMRSKTINQLPVKMPQPVQQQANARPRLHPGAQVKMTNQPNSVPINVLPDGETIHGFMKRVENDRGLSLSKSGFHHLDISSNDLSDDLMVNKQGNSNKKGSIFSKMFH